MTNILSRYNTIHRARRQLSPNDPDAIVYLESLTTSLSLNQQLNIDSFTKELKTNLSINSLSDGFDFIYLAQNETEEAFMHNLVKRSHDLTKIGTPTFTASNGVKGSSGNYYKTNYIPLTNAVVMSQNSLSCGVFINEDIEINASKIPMGAFDSSPVATQIFIIPSLTGDYQVATNSIGNDAKNDYNRDYPGCYAASRNNATQSKSYINFRKYINSSNSLVLGDKEIFLLARNLDGSQNANYDKYCSMFFMGKGFSDGEIYAITKAFKNYQNRINTSVLGDNIGIVGDSIADDTTTTFAWPSKIERPKVVTNYAFSGDSISGDMTTRVANLTDDVYEIIILALGTNDNNAGDMNALQTIVENNITTIKNENPSATIYYMNVLPRWDDVLESNEIDKSNIRTMIESACSNQSITCWDTYNDPWISGSDTQDGTHPTSSGAQKIWNRIKALI